MKNDFIDYLRSMNNATSGNINALAESQVTNKFYDAIRVDRKLGTYISDNIKSGKKEAYILTGHAGDGKTSVLVQVLKDLNLIEMGQKLKVQDEVIKDNISLFYVKDMSELEKNLQVELLEKALKSPENNSSSILISNTGPLLKAFESLLGKTEEDKDNIENVLLNQLDNNESKVIEMSGYKFHLINIARVDNVGFAKEIINKICSKELWSVCENCNSKEKCPSYFNYKCINENKTRVTKFVEAYYRWLYENDNRITIRQMLAQISFAITGNVKCDEIKKWDQRIYLKFQYNFANLFFGFRGIQKISSANQIKAIDMLQKLNLDSKVMNTDYNMFVKNEFNELPQDIRHVIDEIWSIYSTKYHNTDEENNDRDNDANMRRAIRRFYLMYSTNQSDDNTDNLFSNIFGEAFVQYKEFITKRKNSRAFRPLRNMIFEALYIKNIGVPPKGKQDLYLTLTRHDGAFQSVLLLLGSAKYDDFDVVQEAKVITYEDIDEKYDIYLSINRGREKFRINLPMLIHFQSIVDGAISTEINPALSHGLAELNSKLLKEFREEQKDTINIIVNTVNGAKPVKLEVDDGKLFIV